MKSSFDALIVAKDEQENIGYSLKSLQGWANKVFVVDSGSSDHTREIAREHGAIVVDQPWLGHAKQKNWALDALAWESPWILIVDADEVVMPDLRAAIDGVLARPIAQVEESGFYINRYFVFLGRRIRHSGYYPSYNLRFFKRGEARYEDREVHEHMVTGGKAGYLPGHLEHNDRRGLEHYMEKHNRYSTLEAREIHRVLSSAAVVELEGSLFGGPIQRRRWIKERVYPRLPAKWLWRFAFMYVARRGFLDGRVGLDFALFMTAYELLIDLKLKELQASDVSAQLHPAAREDA